MHQGQQRRRRRDDHEFAVEARVEFKVHPRGQFDHRQAVLRKPMFVGDFSLDENRQFCHDQRNLSYIPVDWEMTKKVQYDLNVALEKSIVKNQGDIRKDKLNNMLQWLLLNKQKFHSPESTGKPLQNLNTDFVCFRGLLRDFLCVPYESRERFILCATKFRGTIYLWSYETPEKKVDRQSQTEEQLKMCSWGYKFEQYMTEGNNASEAQNENPEYCCVLRSRLENHSLVYGAEVDGVDPKKYETPHNDLRAFIELKTNKELTEDRDVRSLHKFKLMKWWGQSYLVGIPTVIVGFRDRQGTVHSLKTFRVDDMPSMARDHWKPNVMINFLNKFLTFIKQQVLIDDPQTVYKFEREPNGGDIVCEYLGENADWSFLPKWYYGKMFQE